MTVTNENRSVTYNGDGSTTVFPVANDGVIYFLQATDLLVTLIDADGTEHVQALTTNYTVSGAGDKNGGSVTMLTPPAAGQKLRIERIVDILQPTNYPENTKFPAASHERALDRLTMIDQQQQGEIDRAPKFSETSGFKNVELPAPEDGRGIKFDAETGKYVNTTFDPDQAQADAEAAKEAAEAAKQAAENAQEAAENAEIAAEAAAADAEQSAASSAGTVPISNRSALKALNTTARKAAVIYDEGGRNGFFLWREGDYSAQVAADTAEGIYIKADGVAATSGAWVRDFKLPAKASWFGADQAAIEAAHAVVDEMLIDRPVAITSTATWPNGKNYLFVNGGQLDIANGVTLTIRGQVSAGVWKGLPSSAPRKIFNTTGTGKVVGLRYTRPEWWGALRNGTSDDAPAFNAAQQCMEESMSSDGEICFELSAGSYGLGRSVKSTVKSNYRPVWRGQGSTGATMLVALASFSTANGTAAIQLGGGASEITFDGCHIAGFRLVPQAGTSASTGVLVGGSAATIHAGSHNAGIFEDVNVYDFDTCWRIKNARLFTLRKVGGWVQTNDNAYALEIEAINGETTADLEIENCQFVASATGATSMRINGFGTNSLLTGIRLPGTIFYNGGITISSSSGARVCDVWFDGGWQLDVFRSPIQIACDGATSQLYNLNFNNGYFAGALSGNVMAFNIFTANSGKVRGVRVRGNTFINTQGDVVFANGNVQGYFVEDNVFIDAEGGNLITVGSGVSGAVVTGNIVARHFRTVTADALVATLSGANYYAIRNNMTNGLAAAAVNDAAVGAQRIVDGNL